MKKLFAILLAAMFIIMCVPATAANDDPTGFKLDEMVTEDLDGNEVTGEIFSQYTLTYLNFWATWCGPCLSELPHIQAMYEDEDFAARGLNVMGLLCEDSSSTVKNAKKVLKQNGCTYTNIRVGSDPQLIDLLNNSGQYIPVSYLLNSEGEVIKFTVGGMTKAQMKNFINQGFAMVETEPTPTPTTEPIPDTIPIEKAEITDVEFTPVIGDKVENYLTYTVDEDAPFTVEGIMWGDLETEQELEPDYVFEAGKTYQLAILLSAKTGYIFTEETVISVNGGMELSEESGTEAEGTEYWILTLPTEATEPSENATGDINGDDKINTSDAVFVLKTAAGMLNLTEEQIKAADVDKNGKVDTADAVLILKYAAGMITEF